MAADKNPGKGDNHFTVPELNLLAVQWLH